MPAADDIIRGVEPVHHVRYRAPCNLDCFYCYERPHPVGLPAGTEAAIADDLQRGTAAIPCIPMGCSWTGPN